MVVTSATYNCIVLLCMLMLCRTRAMQNLMKPCISQPLCGANSLEAGGGERKECAISVPLRGVLLSCYRRCAALVVSATLIYLSLGETSSLA